MVDLALTKYVADYNKVILDYNAANYGPKCHHGYLEQGQGRVRGEGKSQQRLTLQ